MKKRALAAFLVAAFASGLIWALSAWLTGHREPWDADGLFYLGALAVAGSLAGALVPRPLWAHYSGAVLGQLGYELVFMPIGPLFVLGVAFLLVYSLVFLFAAAAAGQLRLWARNRAAHGGM